MKGCRHALEAEWLFNCGRERVSRTLKITCVSLLCCFPVPQNKHAFIPSDYLIAWTTLTLLTTNNLLSTHGGKSLPALSLSSAQAM